MPINFTKIFQDTLNFIINQKPLLLSVFAVFVLNNIVTQLTLNAFPPAIEVLNDTEYRLNNDGFIVTVSVYIISLLLMLWLLNLIIQISKGQAADLATALRLSLGKVIPFIFINILCILPLGFGASSIAANPSLIGLLSFCLGGYLFLRLLLIPFAYIIENSTVGEAFKLVWLNSSKRLLPLLLLALATYVLPLLISAQLANLGNSLFATLLASVVTAAVTLFTVVFSYRFYQLFIDKKNLRTH